MSNLLGVIKAVIGLVYVVEADGSQRLLKEGDRIYSGEEIVTGDSGAVSMTLPDGKTLDLGRNSHWSEHGLNAVNAPEHDTQDVASIQKAIADGADPTQALEATAAGNEPPVAIEGGGGGHTLVQLDLTGQIVDPTAGFKTAGLGDPVYNIHLPEGGLTDGGSPPVLPPQVNIDDFAGNDGYVNKNKINHANISGTSNQNHITLTFTDSQKNIITIDVPVNNGHWTATPDLSSLHEGDITVIATATDVSGRSAISTTDAVIDVTDLHDNITIDSVTPDNVINITESHQPQTLIHGVVSGDAKIGDAVTLTVDGKAYSDVVIYLGNGTLGYQINVSTQGLLASPNIHATVTSTDEAGNTTQASSDHHVDIDLNINNSVTIGTVANDDIVNANESRMPSVVSGVAGGDAQAGDPITVTLQGQQFHGVVINDNGQLRYAVSVPTSLLKEGANEVQVQLVSHDAAGNEATAIAHHTITLDTQAHNALSFETVAGDDTVNSVESRMPTLISGEVSGDAQVGDRVVVSVNNQEFYGQVINNNGTLRYEVAVPTAALNEGRNDVQVMVSGVDSVDNTAIAVEHKVITLDTQASNAVTINTVAGDDTVNNVESRMPTLVSGEVSGDAHAGDQVVVSVNGKEFYGQVTDENGKLRYEVAVPTAALNEGQNAVQVMVTGTDSADNTALAVDTKTIVLDTQAHNAVTIETVAGGDTVNRAESRMPTLVSGEVNGDALVGDHVVVSVNGHEFYGLVSEEHGTLRYEVAVPTAALNEGRNDVQVMVTGTDSAGNTALAVDTKTIVLDTQAHNAVTIETVAGDDIVNRAESRMPTLVSGEVNGDAQVGDPVVVSVNGHEFYGQVADDHGTLRYEVAVPTAALVEGRNDVQVMVTGTDSAGNTALAVETKSIVLDTEAHNRLTINTTAGDDIVNAGESKHETLVTGQVSGKDAQPGDAVEVLVHNQIFHGQVVADSQGHLRYEVKVPSGTLVEGDNPMTVSVTSFDRAGNEAIAVEHKNVVLDTHANASITVNSVTDDNQLSHAEMNTPFQLIQGEVQGDARIGDKVLLEIGGQHFGGNVIDLGNGKLEYQIPVDSAAFGDNQTKIDGDVTFKASVTSHDAAHNEITVTTSHTLHVDNYAVTGIHIGTVAGDDTVNMIESRMPTMITGSVSGDAKAGDPVEVSFNGRTFNGEVTGEPGHLYYEVAVPTQTLDEGKNDVTIKIVSHDALGNEATATDLKTITLDTQAQATITINDVTKDNVLNHAELNQHTQTITGFVGGDASVGDEVTLEVNGKFFTGRAEMIGGKLGYQIPVNSSAFSNNHGDVDKDVKFTATVISHDAAGNEAIQITDHTVHLDNHAINAITVETVASDDIVNMNESRMPTLISGEVTGEDAKVGDKVVVHAQGIDYNSTVFADENGNLRYEVAVPQGKLVEGNNDVKVTVTSHDAAQNEVNAVLHHNVEVDTQAHSTNTIDNIILDNTLNFNELSNAKQLVSGVVGGDAKVGDDVTVEINGHHFTGNVIELSPGKLGYQIVVDSSAFNDNQKDVDADVKVTTTVTSFDGVKNEVITTAEHTVHIDNHADGAITMALVTGDNTINHHESRLHTTKVTGTVSGEIKEGDKVIVTVNNHSVETTVIQLPNQHGALGYSVDVLTRDLLADHNPTAYVVAHDQFGNQHRIDITNPINIDLQAEATITIDPVAGDNMINGAEVKNPITVVTGTVGGDVKVGDLVHLLVNGQDLTTRVVNNNGQLGYSINVSTHDLISDPHLTATVSATDAAGNVADAQSHQGILVDTQVIATISVDSVTVDNTLNDEELNHQFTLVSGKVDGEMKVGDPLTLTINHRDYPGFVEKLPDGKMGYNILVETHDLKIDPNIHASIGVTDLAGNSTVATNDHQVNIDDRADASLTINIVSGDDVLNQHDQASATTTINGRVGGEVALNDVVDVTVDGVVYHATVAPQTFLGGDLGYTVDVPTQGLLNNPHILATVSITDGAGNIVTAGSTHDVSRDDSAQATITIDPVTDDNTINNAEAHQPYTTVTGHVTGDVHAGDRVELNINGQHYYGNVNDKGRYSIDVSTDDLISGSNKPVIHASVMGSDAAGNTLLAEFERVVNIDTRADVTIDVGSLHMDGHHDMWLIEGHVYGDAKLGDVVKIKAGGETYETTVKYLPDGKLGYNADDLIDHKTGMTHLNPDLFDNDKEITVQVTSTDPHGNTETASAVVSVAGANNPGNTGNNNTNTGGTTTPTTHTPHADITISPVAGNDVINKVESQSQDTVIRGVVTGEVHGGEDIIVRIGVTDYPGKVVALPNLPGEYGYAISVNTQNLVANHDITVSMPGFDTHCLTKTISVDTNVTAEIHLDNIADDNVINIAEAQKGTTTVSGTVHGDHIHVGSNVTLMVNGHPVTTQVYDDAGVLKFSKEVSIDDLRQAPNITASVTGYDDQGNVIIASDGKSVTVDTHVEATISIDNVTTNADNIINDAESHSATTLVTGKVTGDVEKGDLVTVNVNGNIYQNVHVDDHHQFSVAVQTDDLIKGKSITAEVTGQDAAGNSLTVNDTRTVSVDLTSHANIDIYTVSGDGILSAKDLTSATTEISGTVDGDAKIGNDVIVTINNVPTTVQVVELPHMNGVLGYVAQVNTADLKANPTVNVSVIVTDNAGNTFEATNHVTLTIDDHADVSLNFNDVTGDNVLNAAESGQPQTEITGTVTGDVLPGDKVMVNVNGNDLQATIEKDATGQMTFKVMASTADLLQNQHITYTVTGTDNVGNSKTFTASNTIVIDQKADNSIHIDTVSHDDKVNIVESQQPTTAITGTVDGDVHAGDTVWLNVNGQPFTGQIVDQNGHMTWSIDVNNSVLKEGDNTVAVSVTGQDAAENSATSTDTHTFTLDTHIDASININTVANNNVVNGKTGNQISITGVVDGDAKEGDIVTLNVNGHEIKNVKVIQVGDHLGYDVRMDKHLLHEGNNDVTVSVRVTDDAGNHLRPAFNQVVTLDSHADATLTVDSLTADNTINARESRHISVTGQVDGDAKVGDTVTLEVNGHTMTTEVKSIGNHLGYEFEIKKGWMQEGHNDLNVSVSVIDGAGNHLTTPAVVHPVYFDTKIDASIDINPVADHNLVNAKTADHIMVTGHVGLDAKLGDVVQLEINSHSVPTHVVMVNGGLGYEVQMDKAWLNDGDNTLNVSVSTEDHAGNTITVSSSQKIVLDTHADATLTLNKVTGDNHIDGREAHSPITHITGQVDGDVQDGDRVNALVNGVHYHSVIHDNNGQLSYDIAVRTADMHDGHNTVKVAVAAHDDHGNANTFVQKADVTMDHSGHHGKHDANVADKSHHAANVGAHHNGLSNLFGDSDDVLSLYLHHSAKAQQSDEGQSVFTGHATVAVEKIDLSDLAHQLNDVTDVAQLIKGGDVHHHKADVITAGSHPGHAHGGDAGVHDSHGTASYSLDHLIAKPEHYSH